MGVTLVCHLGRHPPKEMCGECSQQYEGCQSPSCMDDIAPIQPTRHREQVHKLWNATFWQNVYPIHHNVHPMSNPMVIKAVAMALLGAIGTKAYIII